QLSRLRAKLVRQSTLADVAREFGLGDHLILGIGELKSGGFERDSILSDTVEAIIGAMYLDTNLEFVQNHVATWFESRLDLLSLKKPLKDAKSRLQEYLQSRQINLPAYEVVSITGQAHDQTFLVECQCELFEDKVSGQGSSRRIAEQNAASTVLSRLGIEFDRE
ncbi:MAG: ribonuclease-3, partial [Candidatus Azotimanducaceae bacterium]